MSDAILEYSLTEVAAGIRKKEFSSEEVTRNCLEKIEELQPKLNCFISVYREEAIKAAKYADTAIASGDELGSLHGVPLAHKDMFTDAVLFQLVVLKFKESSGPLIRRQC